MEAHPAASTESQGRLSIYFDGGCRVCAWEIEKYLAADREGKLLAVDINSPHFRAETLGLSSAQVRKYFHVRTPDGRLIAGVDAFVEIWRTLGTPIGRFASRLARLARLGPIHAAMRAGYRIFVEIRPLLPRKAGAPECADGTCAHR